MEPKRSLLRTAGCVSLLCALANSAGAVDLGRPDAHAPLGVMGDHVHEKGEVMLSYRYMRMEMEGMRDGTEHFSPQEVFNQGFGVTPTKMNMQMHMWGVMYAPLDALTLMAMIPLVELSMDHITAGGGRFTTDSLDIGDVSLTGLIELFDSERHAVHLGVGFSAPTGPIKEVDFTLPRLPYPMQPGSGSWSILPSATWNGQFGAFSLGAQAGGVIRLNENDQHYTLGDRAHATGWGAYRWTDGLSTSLRLAFSHRGNIDGMDPVIVFGPVPTADPRRQGGDMLEVGFGANYYFGGGPLAGFRLALEVLVPAWRRLDGPQLETDWTLASGVQYLF